MFIVRLIWMGFLLYKTTSGQGCFYPGNPFPRVNETDPAGSILVQFEVTLAREVWSIDQAVLNGYVDLRRQNDTIELVTLKPLDLEEMNNASSSVGTRLKITLSCVFDNRPPVTHDINILITSINEFDPYFIGAPYHHDVEENTALQTTVFTLSGKADDEDFLPSQQPISQFRLHGIYPQVPDVFFAMTGTINGVITTQKLLDYEALLAQGLTTFVLNVSAEDNGDPGPRSAFTTITVNVKDVDDESPAFVYDCQCTTSDCPPKIKGLCQVPAYYTAIAPTHTGDLQNILPSPIFAVDGDMLNYSIAYSIVAGSLRNHSEYFTIDSQTGVVTQILEIDDLDVDNFVLTIQATEVSIAQRQAIRGLTISVSGRTVEPPRITDKPPSVQTDPPSNTTEPAQESTKDDDGDSIALWVLLVAIGSCLLLGLLIALGVYIFLRKRHKTNPDDSQSSGPSNVSTEEEILDAYASETQESKWNHNGLDLSVRSAYGPQTNSTFLGGTSRKDSYINSQMTNHGNLGQQRHFDLAVPLPGPGKLPPLNKADMVDTSTETEETEVRKLKRKPRKRRDKSLDEEIYDGTRTYEMEADPSFFTTVPKNKVKRNRRSFNFKPAPDHWITVPNEY